MARSLVLIGGGAIAAVVIGGVVLEQAGLLPPIPQPTAPDAQLSGPAEPVAASGAAQPAAREVRSDAPETLAENSPSSGRQIADEAGATPEIASNEAASALPVSPSPAPPRIDLLRVDPSGSALLAGRGLPGSVIDILLDRVVIAEARSETDGTFTTFLDLPAADGPRSVSLVMRSQGVEIASRDVVIIAPATLLTAGASEETPGALAAPAGGVPVVVTDATSDIADPDIAKPDIAKPQTARPEETGPEETGTGPVAGAGDKVTPAGTTSGQGASIAAVRTSTGGDRGSDETQTPGAKWDVVTAPPEAVQQPPHLSQEIAPKLSAPPDASASALAQADSAVAPVVLRADAQGLQVLAVPGGADDIALDTITYDPAGAVSLAGRGSADFVRIYIDNSPVTRSRIAADGSWRVELPEINQGVYTLRVDAVEADGRVSSRVETPFKRESRAVLAARDDQAGDDLGDTGSVPLRVVTVQPGNTLWALARERYGAGPLYVRIFQANRDNIRNPDLIYPGQVFDLPETPPTE